MNLGSANTTKDRQQGRTKDFCCVEYMAIYVAANENHGTIETMVSSLGLRHLDLRLGTIIANFTV